MSKADVLAALGGVMDPHMNISVVEMNMIRDVRIAGDGTVGIDMVFPCIGCPAWTMIQNDMREAAEAVPGVAAATVRVVWDEPWHKSSLSSEARRKIRSFGYQIMPME